jgi:hypothetical protein
VKRPETTLTFLKGVLKKSLWNVRNVYFMRRLYFAMPLSFRRRIRSVLIPQLHPNLEIITPNLGIEFDQKDFLIDDSHLVVTDQVLVWNCNKLSPKEATYNITYDSLTTSEVLTADIWDTAIGRFRPAESVKRATSLEISMREWQSRGFRGLRFPTEKLHKLRNEIEAKETIELGESSFLSTHKTLFNKLGFGLDPEEFATLEIESEKLFTYPISQVKEYLEFEGNLRFFISDFYFSSNSLEEILLHHAFKLDGVRVISSSDERVTKRDSGKLFKKLGLGEVNNWSHVGDNPNSDWIEAEKLGAQVCKVAKFSDNAWQAHDHNEVQLAKDLSKFLGNTEAERFLIDVAIVTFSLCTAAIERALSSGKKQVVYLSREGETLNLAHNQIMMHKFHSHFRTIGSIHLPISRSAAVMASWAEDLEKGFKEVSLQYPTMNVDTLIDTLSAPEYLENLLRQTFPKFEVFRTRSIWKRLSPETKLETISWLESQKFLIRDYLVQLDISSSNSVLSDIGWRGSIQNALNRIMDEQFIGQYLGLYAPFQNSEQENSKFGLLFDEKRGSACPDYLTFLGPVERALTITDRQVSSYQKNTSGVEPVFHRKAENISTDRVNLIKSSLPHCINQITTLMTGIGIYGSDSAEFLREVLRLWMNNPNSYHSSNWFDELHREGFGVGGKPNYFISTPNASWIGKNYHSQVLKGARESLWPTGYLAWMRIKKIGEMGTGYE